MSRCFILAVIVLSLGGTVSSQVKKAEPDPYEMFQNRKEYGVPIFSKIPYLNRYFTNTAVSKEYYWDDPTFNTGVVSPDGRFFLTGTQDGRISLWNLEEPKKSRQDYISIRYQESSWGGMLRTLCSCCITNLAFTPDGSRFALTFEKDGNNHEIQVFETETGTCLKRIAFPESTRIHCRAFSPCGRLLAFFGSDRNAALSVCVLDLEAETQILERQLPMVKLKPRIVQNGKIVEGEEQVCADSVTFMSFSPDSRNLLVSMWESGTELWDLKTGEVITRLIDQDSKGFLNGFSSDGKQIFVAGNDEDFGEKQVSSAFLSVWDLQTGQRIKTWTPEDPGSTKFVSVAFTPDGKQILTAAVRTLVEKNTDQNQTQFQQDCIISEWDPVWGTLLESRSCDNFGGALPLVRKYQPLYNNGVGYILGFCHFFEIMGADFDLAKTETETMK